MENTAEKIVTLNNETEDNVDVRKDSVVNIDFKMVAFSLAGKDYAIDILKVKEIAKAKAINALTTSAYECLKSANTDFEDYLDSLIGTALFDIKNMES